MKLHKDCGECYALLKGGRRTSDFGCSLGYGIDNSVEFLPKPKEPCPKPLQLMREVKLFKERLLKESENLKKHIV